jgi:hypothetical protein
MPPRIALILMAFASLTMAKVEAYDSGFISGSSKVIRQINVPATIKRVNGNEVVIDWMGSWWSRYGGTQQMSHEGTLHLTDKTVFTDGTRANVVVGAVVRVRYHFEGGHAIASRIRFLNGPPNHASIAPAHGP